VTTRRPSPSPGPSPGYRLAIGSDSVEIGGAERFLEYLLGALPAEADVVVFGPDPVVLAAIATRRPTTVIEVVPTRFRPVRRMLAHQRPDVVLANLTTFTSCRPAILAALSLRLPTVLVDHSPTPGLTWKGRPVQRVVTTLAARRVAVGDETSRAVERLGGLRPGTVRTIRNGVPSVVDGPEVPTRHPPVLGALGRLEREKGFDVLLEALRLLLGVRLVLAGDGSERARLDQLSRRLGIDERVEFLGWCRATDEVLHRVDVLVVPSRVEGLPLSLLEAMHRGLPVVASDVGSVRQAVTDRQTGLIVPPEDPAALARALGLLLADDGLRARLGAAGRAKARAEFSDVAMAEAYDALFRSVTRRTFAGRATRPVEVTAR
jgi:glycosyltransferase involved in cell wall biosynthesis